MTEPGDILLPQWWDPDPRLDNKACQVRALCGLELTHCHLGDQIYYSREEMEDAGVGGGLPYSVNSGIAELVNQNRLAGEVVRLNTGELMIQRPGETEWIPVGTLSSEGQKDLLAQLEAAPPGATLEQLEKSVSDIVKGWEKPIADLNKAFRGISRSMGGVLGVASNHSGTGRAIDFNAADHRNHVHVSVFSELGKALTRVGTSSTGGTGQTIEMRTMDGRVQKIELTGPCEVTAKSGEPIAFEFDARVNGSPTTYIVSENIGSAIRDPRNMPPSFGIS